MITRHTVRRRWPKVLAILMGALAALIVAGLFALPFIEMHSLVDLHVQFNKSYAAEDYGLASDKLTLTTGDGLKLATYRVDAESPRAAVIFVSGIHSPSVTAFFGHAAMLRKEGFSSLLVEMRAHGESEGDRICLGTKEVLDVQAAVQYLKGMNPDLPVVVCGLSMGAGTAVNAIGETPQIDALITLSAFSTWPDVFAYNMEMMGIPKFLCEMEKPFVWVYMGVKYGADGLKLNPLDGILKLNGRPALLMHSKGDTQVPYASFEMLKAAAPEAETYVVDGDHHFICDDHFLHPEEDKAYSAALLGFLNEHF